MIGCPIHSMDSASDWEYVQMRNVTRTALSFGTSATLARAAGENSDDLQFVAGVRAWF
ncbi:MAG: copper resistance protein B [Gammaproteobacteria bacterium]|nr:MAG: copper resistance protein B [Gammaproteobacteria bacterium]TLZ15179.1 MAG: copper resistance protein B [Gammaproteobacteria bacterium]